jgi:hypothetical protein
MFAALASLTLFAVTFLSSVVIERPKSAFPMLGGPSLNLLEDSVQVAAPLAKLATGESW